MGGLIEDAYQRVCRTLNFFVSARCELLTTVEGHTQINQVDKINLNLAKRSLLLAAVLGRLRIAKKAPAGGVGMGPGLSGRPELLVMVGAIPCWALLIKSTHHKH